VTETVLTTLKMELEAPRASAIVRTATAAGDLREASVRKANRRSRIAVISVDHDNARLAGTIADQPRDMTGHLTINACTEQADQSHQGKNIRILSLEKLAHNGPRPRRQRIASFLPAWRHGPSLCAHETAPVLSSTMRPSNMCTVRSAYKA